MKTNPDNSMLNMFKMQPSTTSDGNAVFRLCTDQPGVVLWRFLNYMQICLIEMQENKHPNFCFELNIDRQMFEQALIEQLRLFQISLIKYT